MSIFVSDIPQRPNLFETLTIEAKIAPLVFNRPKVISYFLTEYPRIDPADNEYVQFVYGLFENRDIAFSPNQTAILRLSSEMFAESRTLNFFEEEVLNYTFNRLIKKSPTRTNRI